MAVMGTPSEGCDITSPLRSGFQTLHEKSKMSRREVEWRDGESGGGMVAQACGTGPGDRGIAGCQGGAGGQGGAGRAGGAEDPHGGADDHHSKVDGTKDPHSGAEDHFSGAEKADMTPLVDQAGLQ